MIGMLLLITQTHHTRETNDAFRSVSPLGEDGRTRAYNIESDKATLNLDGIEYLMTKWKADGEHREPTGLA